MVILKKASREAVRYACMNFHYAKAVPSSPYAYNVYTDRGGWCGCVIFGPGASPHLGMSVGLKQGEYLELVRVALNGKQPCTSEVVAACLRQIHRDAPEIKIIISFADKDQNHFGTIYQATNWIYLGDYGIMKGQSYIVNGKKYHNKTVKDKGLKKTDLLKIDPNMVEVSSLGKRKYIYVFDKKLRREWMKQAKPYPKKVEE